MKSYIVGGWVRDLLLAPLYPSQKAHDKDWVVVGATPSLMVSQGFKPVGNSFPVFLHPKTHEEYALARTEKKSGHGYKGFTFYASSDVTLDEDLSRRDLTMNAIALDTQTNTLHDPYNGQQDIRDHLLRHIQSSFTEDPLRVLRVARFAAQLPSFRVHPSTLQLLRAMVASGETRYLTAERIQQEMLKGLNARQPTVFIDVLQSCGLWQHLYPYALWRSESELRHALYRNTFDPSTALWMPLCILGYYIQNEQDCQKFLNEIKAPKDAIQFTMALRLLHDVHNQATLSLEDLQRLMTRWDVVRRPAIFERLLQIGAGPLNISLECLQLLKTACQAWRAVDTAQIVQTTPPSSIAQAILKARLNAVTKAISPKKCKLN